MAEPRWITRKPSMGDESILSDITGFTGEPQLSSTTPTTTTRNTNTDNNNGNIVVSKSLFAGGSPKIDEEASADVASSRASTSTAASNIFRREHSTSSSLVFQNDNDEDEDVEYDDDESAYMTATHMTATPPRRPSKSQLAKQEGDVEVSMSEHANAAAAIVDYDDSDDDNDDDSIDFLRDPRSEMTWSRRMALALLHRFQWYNPRLGQDHEFDSTQIEPVGASMHVQQNNTNGTNNGTLMTTTIEYKALEAYPFSHSRRENPSLEKAWAYFEHVALPRYVVQPKPFKKKKNVCHRAIRKLCCKGSKQLQKAEPGEKHMPTRLYHPLFTPHKQLGDFGLGIGLYFSTLRAITVLTILAGLLNIPNLLYFSGPDYSLDQDGVRTLLKGSAICTNTSWVPCTDCLPGQFESRRLMNATNAVNGNVVTLALRNFCNGATFQQGMVNYGTLLLIMVGTIALNAYLRRMEVAFDEDEQTAQDYSIVIENPPGDATDPEEWRKFFYDNFDGAHVTACTVAVDNDLLVRSLVERREKLRQLEMKVEPGTSLDRLTLAGLAAKEERERRFLARWLSKIVPGIPEIFGQLVVLTAKIQGLAQQDYPATNVFVTFETEADQRYVLSVLSVGDINKKAKIKNPNHLFRGSLPLSVKEPDEPNTIRWQDLNEKFKECLKQQIFTLACTFAAIALIAFIISVCNNVNVTLTAFVIAISNSVFPMFAKFLTSCEAHSSEGGKQTSLYCKIAVFRWVNTAIVITIITPFTSSLTYDQGLIPQIYALFFAEIVTTSAIQLADPVGHLKRHFLAPRASTQDSMNLNFSGAEFELAERYTNMTKILFLALWYCAIYPAAFFMCALSLFINYFTDRFSLMRTWKRQPHLGTRMSEVSRRYFFSLAIVAMAIVSSYYWSAFPFDNLCKNNNSTAGEDYSGTFTVGGETRTIDEKDPSFRYCLQDFWRFPRGMNHFPFISAFQPEGGEWMTDEQATVTNIYGWSAIGVILIISISFLWGWLMSFMGLFRSTYIPRGEDQGINFSDVPSISSYVPQVESPFFAYPLLACNIDDIDYDLLDWTDPDRPYSFYDLTKDAEVLLRGTDVSSKVVFSQIAHWPPEKKNS